jgi:hypothetical protein
VPAAKPRTYYCSSPPCIHVVWDERRKIYAVFVEIDDENIFELDPDKLEIACRSLSEVKEKKYRRANLQETDFLATRYLGAKPVEE